MADVRKITFAVATSVLAAAITYVVFSLSDSLAPLWRWLLVAATALISFAAAWFTTRRVSNAVRGKRSRITIGHKIRAGQDAEIQDIAVKPSGTVDARIGNNIRSKRDVRISRVEINNERDQK